MRGKHSIEVLNDSSWEKLAELTQSSFSIRFKVRGGFRRGNYRAYLKGNRLQSALRFAVVPDFVHLPRRKGGSRCFNPL